jgi:SYP6 family syntaxin
VKALNCRHMVAIQVEELDRATGVTERDPARFSIDSAEIERRKQWTASTCRQVQSIRHNLHSATQNGSGIRLGMAMSDRRELMRMGENHLPNSNQTVDDDFLTDESGQQALIMKIFGEGGTKRHKQICIWWLA